MKFVVVVVSAVLAVAKAGVIAPIALPTAAVLVGQHSSQYHSQDAIGQYAYGYSNELSAKNEIKSADGQTLGSYSYVDAEGKLQNVQYRSDALHGFRVAATNLPVAPSPIEAPALPLPEPVKDTAEVAEARARHLEALSHAEEEAKKSTDESATVEVKSIAPAAAVELVRAAPIIAAPAFSYSFGIDHAGLILAQQPIVTAYAAAPAHLIASPGQLIAAPIVPGAVAVSAPAVEAAKDLPEVVEARAKKGEPEEESKKE